MAVVEVRALGRRKKLLEDFSVPLPPPEDGGDRTLRDVIAETVRAQVAAFRKRQEDNRFLRALTAEQIEAAAEKGKVLSGGTDIEPQVVDAEGAVANALCAFEDGIYLVAVDGRQVEDLDEAVRVTDETRIAFIRLTLLAGG